MSNTVDYLVEYGNRSFDDMPFCEADAITVCEAFYMPLERVISGSFDDAPVPFKDACDSLFAALGKDKYKRLGLGISPNCNKNLERMSQLDRFAATSLVACRESYGVRPAVQYGAATLVLPNGTNVVSFRGTDDTIAGWKEDADIFTKKTIPSYDLALSYVKELAEKREGDIILCGHSKGGHVALWAAVKSDEKIRSRIRRVYNFDGPGYCDYSLFAEPGYKELLPRYDHLVPYSSFVGMMLAHDYDYTPIDSTKRLGPMQHNLNTWCIENGKAVTVGDTDKLAKITDAFFADLLDSVTPEGTVAVDSVLEKAMEGIVYPTLTETVKHIFSAVKGARDGIRELEPAVRDEFKAVFANSRSILKGAIARVTETAAQKAAAKFNPAQ